MRNLPYRLYAHPGVTGVRNLPYRLYAHPGVTGVRNLPYRLYAHPGGGGVRNLPYRLYAPPGVASVRNLPYRLYAHPGGGGVVTFPIACTPIPALPACGTCPIPFTPAGANPAALSPQPPARHLGVTRPVRVLQCATDALPLRHQPAVPPAKVDMRHGIVGSFGNGRRLIFHSPPEIRNEPARVAYDLKRGSARRGKQHGSRPAERFDVLRRRPEPSPNGGRN